MTMVKICGIKEPEMAYAAAKMGADWIGIILVPQSRRFVTMEAAMEICHAAHEGGAKAVAVFYESDEEILHRLPLDGAQFYSTQISLPSHWVRFYANHCPLKKDEGYLLFDNFHGGSGTRIDPSLIYPTPGRKWFLAGGLSPVNVRECIDRFNPDGVDVSSGVEKNGHKEKDLIQKFIEEVRHG